MYKPVLVAHVEQELFTFPEHMSSPLVISGVRIARSLVFCLLFCHFVLFLLTIALSVLLRSTASDYLLGIFKLFLATVASRP